MSTMSDIIGRTEAVESIMLVEFSYLTPEIRAEFLGVLQHYVDVTITEALKMFPVPVPKGRERVLIGDIWLQSANLLLVEFKSPTPQIREWFLKELKQYIDDGIAPDLPYEEKVVYYERRYAHIVE